MNHKMTLLFLLILAPFTQFALAEDVRYYDVEVILFENLDKNARESEIWPSSVELELPETTIEIGKPWPGQFPKEYEPRLTFKPLKAQAFRLNEQAEKINESASRRILLHSGWRQPGMPKETAMSVHFKRSIPGESSLAVDAPESSSEYQEMPPSPWAKAEKGELEGLITVTLARYLHVNTDLVFRPEDISAPDNYFLAQEPEVGVVINETAEVKPVVYRMQQTRRRMRSRELHYLDNPVIGMLILITPYEKVE